MSDERPALVELKRAGSAAVIYTAVAVTGGQARDGAGHAAWFPGCQAVSCRVAPYFKVLFPL